MDYAPNGNLRQRHPKNTRLPLEAIVSYIKQVADALQYAHDEKFIHRDIKPENMLLGRRNEILLSDFGIALIAQSTRMQSTQEVVGTAYYMAPEQLQGKPRLASDQYALGIVVYEWLTGSRPFHGSFSEIASQHMFVPPAPLHEKVPGISPAVEEVVMTALAKDPHKRFGSVRAFATALEQASESTRTSYKINPPSQSPVESRQPSWLTPPSQPLVQSGPQPAILQSGPITSPSQVRLQPNTSPPLSQASPPVNTNPPSQIPSGSSSAIPPRRTESHPNPIPRPQPTYQPHPTTPPRRPVSSPPDEPDTVQSPKRRISRRAVLLGLTAAGLAVAGGGITWYVLSQKPPVGTVLYTYRDHSNAINAVAWSPDGQRIASGGNDGTVQIWDATTGSGLLTHTNYTHAVAWSPDGKRIASGSNSGGDTLEVWSVLTGKDIVVISFSNQVRAVAWSPDGQRLASVSDNDTGQVLDASTGNNIFTYSGAVYSVAWSPDGQRIASASSDQIVQVWDAPSENDVFNYPGHSGVVYSVAWSPNGQRIASAGGDHTVQVWDASNGSNVFTYRGHSAGIVYSVAWSPDGQHIASAADDHTVQVWNASNGSDVFTYRGHSDTVYAVACYAVAWSPDGQRIASASADKTVQVWQAS